METTTTAVPQPTDVFKENYPDLGEMVRWLYQHTWMELLLRPVVLAGLVVVALVAYVVVVVRRALGPL